jgi:hypothetical protein
MEACTERVSRLRDVRDSRVESVVKKDSIVKTRRK